LKSHADLRPTLGARAIVADDVNDECIVELAEVLQGTDQATLTNDLESRAFGVFSLFWLRS
jgi:hypothetical protein